MKIWLALLLLVPALALAQEEEISEVPVAPEPDEQWIETEEPPINWVDSSHTAVADQAQAMVEWMDAFFGDPTYDLEKAESLVRIRWNHELDETDDYNGKLKLRGKLRMPRISKRMNLVFSGGDGDTLTADEERDESDIVGVQYTLFDSRSLVC